jgi:hypothetical protein
VKVGIPQGCHLRYAGISPEIFDLTRRNEYDIIFNFILTLKGAFCEIKIFAFSLECVLKFANFDAIGNHNRDAM